jgi:hypothetical protein
LENLLGNSTHYGALQAMWKDTLKHAPRKANRLSYVDFLELMKGQPQSESSTNGALEPVLEIVSDESLGGADPDLSGQAASQPVSLHTAMDIPARYKKMRSRSFDHTKPVVDWDAERTSSLAMLPFMYGDESGEFHNDPSLTPLVANRAIYRRHRVMRMAVTEASKSFDRKRNERNAAKETPMQAGLIMKRGSKPPVELQDAHTRCLFDAAAKRCGRSGRARNKTTSDVTGMLLSHA